MSKFLRNSFLLLSTVIFFLFLTNNAFAQYDQGQCPDLSDCTNNPCAASCQGASVYCGESTGYSCAYTCFGCADGGVCSSDSQCTVPGYICVAGLCVLPGQEPTTCSSWSGWGACNSGYQARWCSGGTGDWGSVYQIQQCGGGDGSICGDGACNGSENSTSCPADCSGGGGTCGDDSCDSGENCSNCSNDCGLCGGAYCGDGACSGAENCSNCATDCGSCGGGGYCGDGSCSGFETCTTCSQDCGVCPTNFAWWQVAGGGAYSHLNIGYAIQSIIPSSSSCIEPFCTSALFDLNLAGDTASDGFPITGGGTVDTSGQAVTYRSPDVKAVSNGVTRLRENYSFFSRQYSISLSPTHNYPSSPSDALKPTYDAGTEYYFHDGDMTIQTSWSVADTESYVIFVDGNLTVTDPGDVGQLIQVAQGGFLAFIVSGNIEFDQTVGTNTLTSTTPNVEGIYIADGTVTIESNGGLDEKFISAGTIVGWTDVIMQRDYNDQIENTENPTELFIYRPDLVRNTPQKMKRSQILWQETN